MNNELEPISIEVPCDLSKGALYALWTRQNDNEFVIGIRGENNNAQIFLPANSARKLRDTLDAYIEQLPAFDD